MEQWNSATQDYPDKSCLHDMFRESAKKNRDATAIVYKASLSLCSPVAVAVTPGARMGYAGCCLAYKKASIACCYLA